MIAQTPTMILGWSEWVGLPTLGVPHIKAKLDTGALTSALHAHDIEAFHEGGVAMVRFNLHPVQRKSEPSVACTAPLLDRRSVRSSSGALSRRLTIVTPVTIAGFTWDIEVTLVGRDEMGFRMLLGRQALKGRALVDPSATYCAGRPPRAKRR